MLVRSRRRGGRTQKCDRKTAQRMEGTVEDIASALERADKQIVESGLSKWVIDNVRTRLGGRCLSRVYLVGNGHFDAPWEPGSHQLALIRRICHSFNAELVFQEPCISSAERVWLSGQEGVVIRDCSSVAFDVLDSKDDNMGIVVFLHGLHELLNSYLSLNWQLNLCNILLLCNDYTGIIFIGGSPKTDSNFPALNAFRKLAKFIPFPEYDPNPSSFLHCSIAYLETGTVLPQLAPV